MSFEPEFDSINVTITYSHESGPKENLRRETLTMLSLIKYISILLGKQM